MNKLCFAVAVVLAVAIASIKCASNQTPAEQCQGENFEGLRERIQVIPCGAKKCKLRRNTNTTVVFKFKTENDTEVTQLTNNVHAELAGIPLPFVGVSGASACPQVKRADTGEPAPCPLAPGQEYVYTNQFPIESFYPTVPLRVHWALYDGKKNVICFEVPAQIV